MSQHDADIYRRSFDTVYCREQLTSDDRIALDFWYKEFLSDLNNFVSYYLDEIHTVYSIEQIYKDIISDFEEEFKHWIAASFREKMAGIIDDYPDEDIKEVENPTTYGEEDA